MNLPLKSKSQGGFTLTELLVVICIMAIIISAAVPAVTGLKGAGSVNQATAALDGLLEQAREYAVAQNTYVWVAFYTDTNAQGQNELFAAVIASNDGTDPNPIPGSAYSYGKIPSAPLTLLNKVSTFTQLQLKPAGTFTSSQLSSLANLPAAGTVNELSDMAFTLQIPGRTGTTTFPSSIQFLPTGEARNNSSPIDLVEFDLEPAMTSSTANGQNVAVLRTDGLTGQTLVYRR